MEILMERFYYGPEATLGEMHLPDGKIIDTIEQPWNNNMVGKSAIPDGSYLCTPGFYHSGGYDCYDVTNVPGRSLIKIHAANWAHQLRGCIAPNMTWSCDGPHRHRGHQSKKALAYMMSVVGKQPFTLVIRPKTAQI